MCWKFIKAVFGKLEKLELGISGILISVRHDERRVNPARSEATTLLTFGSNCNYMDGLQATFAYSGM